MSEAENLSLGDSQAEFVELVVSVHRGDQESATVRVADGVTARVRERSNDEIEVEVVLSEPVVLDEPPMLGQNAAPRLFGDIKLSLKTIFDTPMVMEPDFTLRNNVESGDDRIAVYVATLRRSDGALVREN